MKEDKENSYVELKEEDFYPPADERTHLYDAGFVEINGDETFEEYTDRFYEDYGDDVFGDDWNADWV